LNYALRGPSPYDANIVKKNFKIWLGTFSVLLLGVSPVVVPVGGFEVPAYATPGLSVVDAPVDVAPGASDTFSVNLSGFDVSASYLVVMSVESGTLSVTLSGAADALYGYTQKSGSSITAREIGFEGTYDDVLATLGGTNDITWTAPSGSPADFDFSISVTETAGPGTFYWPGDGTANSARYYKYVEGYVEGSSPGFTWLEAAAAAQSDTHTLRGINGYLARPSTYEENLFVANKVDAQNIWIGARRGSSSTTTPTCSAQAANNSDPYTQWLWVLDDRTFDNNGPSPRENWKLFFKELWHGNVSTSSNSHLTDDFWDAHNFSTDFFDGSGNVSTSEWKDSGNNLVVPWAQGEPNGGSGTGVECFAATNYQGVKGRWNDFGTSTSGLGYLIEYNAHQMTGLDSGTASATFQTAQAPGQVTNLSASLGSTQATLTWDAPAATNNSAITSYTIEYADNDSFTSATSVVTGTTATTATVSGLDGTVPTYFRVSATNGVGTGTASTASLAKGNQVISWAPETSLELADSGLTLAATLTTGDGNLGYTVVNAGTTGCTTAGSTLSFDSTGSGANGCEVRPTATSSLSSTFKDKNDAATVTFNIARGTFAISSPSSKVGVTSSSFTDVCASTCDITGFAAGDDVLVVVSKSDGTALSGRVRLGSTTGLTQSLDGYQVDATSASGFGELGFEGTQAEVNAALETLQYKSPSGGGDETLGINASLAGSVVLNGRYYQEITPGGTLNWDDARCKAKYGNSSVHDGTVALTHSGFTQATDNCTNTESRRQFNGLNGYLANITTLQEHEFLMDKAGAEAWIGGADIDTEGTWTWVDGPEAGEVFYLANTLGIERLQLNTIPGEPEPRFNYFSDDEPNNFSSLEHFAEFGFGEDGVGSSWNDCRDACSRTSFLVEYGGDGGTVLKEASTTFTVGAPTAPLQVSGASATAGNGQVTLSWSAPNTGGSAITDYVIEQFDADTSTWTVLTDGVSTATSYVVTGLTNGTSYSFRVSAKNIVGTGSVSSTVSASPTAPPPSSGGGTTGGTTPTPAPIVVPASPAPPRIITPTQPTPRPTILQGPVATPGRGFDPTIGTRATIGGAPATVAKRALPSGGLSVEAGAFQFGLNLTNPNGGGAIDNNNPSSTPELRVPTGQSTTFNGGGLLPGSQLQVWLPGPTGNTPKELARVPVRADGTFETELSFTSRQSETPVPIGRQVMQVAGFDENGNQTVVDMTINVAQGPVAPELNQADGSLPQLSPGTSLATSAGMPTPVSVVPLPDQGLLTIGDGQWIMSVGVDATEGSIDGNTGTPVVRMEQNSVAFASGDGFMPGTSASVWMFSEPTLMATVTVDEAGAFTAEFLVDPQFLPAGGHTLQIQGVGVDGFIKSANLGVVVDEPVSLTGQSSSTVVFWAIGIFIAILAILLGVFLLRRRGA
jgi:hypothetical protein